jgi:hypothetical protein
MSSDLECCMLYVVLTSSSASNISEIVFLKRGRLLWNRLEFLEFTSNAFRSFNLSSYYSLNLSDLFENFQVLSQRTVNGNI